MILNKEGFLNYFLIARKVKTLYNKTKEIELVKFTHNNKAILCATKKDNEIWYW